MRINLYIFFIFTIFALSSFAAADGAQGEPVALGAAASLRDALAEVSQAFERETGVRVSQHLAASGAVAEQVLAGAPLDVVIFAGAGPMDRLEKSGAIHRRTNLVRNNLVAGARPDLAPDRREALRRLFLAATARETVNALPEGFRLAMANPDLAPAGQYARQALEKLGVWEAIQPRLVLAEHVRQAAAWAASGDADAGLMYATDARAEKALEVVLKVPDDLCEPIIYPAALVKGREHPSAQAFLDFCAQSPEAARIFRAQGFEMAAPASEKETPPARLSEVPVEPARKPWLPPLEPLLLTLLVASAALLLNALAGLPLAWLMARRDFRGKAALDALLILPLALPPTVIGFALIMAFGRKGPLGAFLEQWTGWTLLFTWEGAVIASSAISFPLFLKPAQTAFQAIPRAYFEEGQLMGMTELQAFWWLGLPMAWRGLACGAALSFARAMGEFGATLMVAGNIPGRTQTLPLAIYSATAAGDSRQAAAYSAMLVLMALGLILIARPLAARLDYEN
jgi:molybdate transport system permease protein